jgi:chorismate dehydratase
VKSLLRVSAVSYLNTKPLLWGLSRHAIREEMYLEERYPALIADDLIEGKTDLALMPVAMMTRLEEPYLIGNHCIAATGPVASVSLFSEVPMEEIETVYLDYQSRTSVRLAQLLLTGYWKKKVVFLPAEPGYIEKIGETTAGVIIGDRALEARLQFPYNYDLAEAWIDWQKLPFVFAAWIATRALPADFVTAFDAAQDTGLAHLPEVVAENPFPHYDLMTYYTQNIHYHLGPEERKGLELFLDMVRTAGL